MAKEFKVSDRVKRVEPRGSQGTVIKVRQESLSPSANQNREVLPLIKVNWDNGSVSYHAPDALQLV